MKTTIARPGPRLLADVKALREDLHQHPELAFGEKRTGELVAARLAALGIEVRRGLAKTGVVGVLRGSAAGAGRGKTIALRADMDALPVPEATGLAYASVNTGKSHACGHDGNVAVLVGAATMLAGVRKRLKGKVVFIFQPAEESGAGGKRMVEDGALRNPRPDAIFALHATPLLGPGQISISPTPNVAALFFDITVRGSGGHCASPHRCVDPVVAGSMIVAASQTIVSREVRPDQPAVVTFGTFHAGTKANVIPDTARLQGSIRAMDMKSGAALRAALERIARATASGLRARVSIAWGQTYPPVHNDPPLMDFVRETGRLVLGAKNVIEAPEQGMGGEDFAYYLTEQGGVPGVIYRLGGECKKPLHSSLFDFGSQSLKPGIAMMANLALRFLA